jgi:hypothetical protein
MSSGRPALIARNAEKLSTSLIVHVLGRTPRVDGGPTSAQRSAAAVGVVVASTSTHRDSRLEEQAPHQARAAPGVVSDAGQTLTTPVPNRQIVRESVAFDATAAGGTWGDDRSRRSVGNPAALVSPEHREQLTAVVDVERPGRDHADRGALTTFPCSHLRGVRGSARDPTGAADVRPHRAPRRVVPEAPSARPASESFAFLTLLIARFCLMVSVDFLLRLCRGDLSDIW